MTKTAASVSEDHGLAALTDRDRLIYSIGVSTGGVAEIRMAEANPKRHIIATTVDQQGVDFARRYVTEHRFSDRIEVKLEDVSQPLRYPDNHFDLVYARLVLHYLGRAALQSALAEIHRILKPGGRLFVVVRSDQCAHAHMPDSVLDPATGLTEYSETHPKTGEQMRIQRFFHSEQSISGFVTAAGFRVDRVTSYDEQLYKDFERRVLDYKVDNLVELLAVK
jgi:SAM-dependent methyltransferase